MLKRVFHTAKQSQLYFAFNRKNRVILRNGLGEDQRNFTPPKKSGRSLRM
jgi:hypothetical protein